jgi:hypothetical protein
MSPANLPSPGLPASGSSLNAEGHHTCTRCPVCASEECKVLEELGMYCETMCAASQAEAADEEARKARRPRRSAA